MNCSCFQSRFPSAIHIALVYSNLGDKERTREWLEKACDSHDPKMSFLKTDWMSLENDPRFQDLLRRVGLVGAK